jgi:hypothetical protein
MVLGRLEELGLYTMGDIIDYSTGKLATFVQMDKRLNDLYHYYGNKQFELSSIRLRTGQCWLLKVDGQPIINEFLGKAGALYNVRQWVRTGRRMSRWITPNDFVKIKDGSASRGAGTDIWLSYQQLFTGEVWRIILDKDKINKSHVLCRKVVAVWLSTHPYDDEVGPINYIPVDMSAEQQDMDVSVSLCMRSKVDSLEWEKRRIDSDEARERYRRKVYHTHQIINHYHHDRMFT